MKKRGQVDEVVNPLSALGKLRSAYQTYKYGTTLPKEIEAVKQARLDTELKKAQVKLAKQGKLPAAADDAASAAAEVKPKGPIGKAVDIVNPFKSPVKKALGVTGLATGYEYLKDPKADIGTLVGRGVKDVVDVGGKALGWAGEKALKFAGDAVGGYTGADSQVADKDKKQPEAARPSDDGVKPLPTRGIGFDELRENPTYRKVLSKYDSFLKEDIDDAFMDAIKGAESGGRNIKNPGSTAYGHYQFLQSTAENMAKDPRNRNTPIYGKSWEEFKQDPKLQREFMKVATQDYKNTLAANKVPVTGGTMYMVHHFGPSKAVKMYQAGPDAKMSDFYPEYIKNRRGETVPNPVYTKNPALKPNQTVQQTHDRLDNLMAKKDKTNTLATIDKKQLWSGSTTVAQNVPSTTSIKPTTPTAIDQTAATSEPRAPLIPAVAGTSDVWKDVPLGGLPKMDWEALRLAARRGEDTEKLDRFYLPTPSPVKAAEPMPTKTPTLTEKYQQFKLQEQQAQTKGEVNWDRASKDYYDMREKKIGKTASQLASASQGQFATRADRLDQAKVDAALGPGFKAGSREANLALLQKFRGQQPQPVQPTQPDQSGQGGKPGPSPSPAVPAVRGAENLTPYTTVADVTGTAGLAAAAGQFLPKVGGVIAKAVPGLNVAYQGADALRRASLGDTTGSAISAVGAVPALGIPAIAAQAVRDKYRTGSFFPSDEELKTAVDRDKGVAPAPATTPAPQAATPKLKEGNKMNKKQLKKRLEKLEETKIQMVQGMHDRAVAEGKIDAAARFAKMLRGLGGGAEALPASTIRKGGQTFDKVRGVDSELKYFNPATRDVKSLDDIKNIGNKPPAVWRKGGDSGATTTATKTAPKAAGAADDVAAAAAKGGKPLSRTASTLAGAAGGALIGYGLGMGGDDKKPEPDPGPGPEPGPRPTPPKPTPDKDQIRGPAHGPGGEEQAQYTDLINKEFSKDKDSDNSRSDSTTDKDSLADRYGADSYVAKVAEGLDDLRRLAGLAKK